MSRSSSPLYFRSVSESSSFSVPRYKGSELKEGAARPLPGRPPPKPPDSATNSGHESNETDHRWVQPLAGHTNPRSETSLNRSQRPPLRSLSLNLPWENTNQSPADTKLPPQLCTPTNSKQPADPRLLCISPGKIPLSTPPTSALPISTPVSEESKGHKSEMVLNNALLIPLSMPASKASGSHRHEVVLSGKSVVVTPMLPPIVNNRLYYQQCMIREGPWRIDKNGKSITIKMECEPDQYENVVDGHPIAKCILDKFQSKGQFYRGDYKKPKMVAAKQCTTQKRKLLPYRMDSSTEKLEKTFAEQFQTHNFIRVDRYDITVPILAVIMYRSAYGVSISLEHFVNSCCPGCCPHSRNVQWTLIKLKEAHDTICRRLMSRKHRMEEVVATCNHWNIIHEVCHPEEAKSWLIEYPHFVEIHDQSCTFGCLYMQIPPYCFAVPLFGPDGSQNDETCHLLQPHFKQVVRLINGQLLDEREKFFKHKPEIRDEKNLGMIYPYRFGVEAECRHLHITIDPSVK